MTQDNTLYNSSFSSFWSKFLWAYHFFIDFTYALWVYRAVKKPVIAVFGSAAICEGQYYYQITHQLCERLAHAGYGIMTGGGSGLMEAANAGAIQAEGKSYSCCMTLHTEKKKKRQVNTIDHLVHSFWLRKLFLIRPACAYIVVPGGFGTMDEVFEVLTLLRTHKIQDKKVIFYGSAYWESLRHFIEHTMVGLGTIQPSDLDYIVWADTEEEVFKALGEQYTHASHNLTNIQADNAVCVQAKVTSQG